MVRKTREKTEEAEGAASRDMWHRGRSCRNLILCSSPKSIVNLNNRFTLGSESLKTLIRSCRAWNDLLLGGDLCPSFNRSKTTADWGISHTRMLNVREGLGAYGCSAAREVQGWRLRFSLTLQYAVNSFSRSSKSIDRYQSSQRHLRTQALLSKATRSTYVDRYRRQRCRRRCRW